MPHIGDRIGPFELVERLRRGRRTSLYRGVRRDSSVRLAHEVLLRVGEVEGDLEVGELLRTEYETLRSLQDERIPRPVALYAGSGALALEDIRGASLRDTLGLVEAGRIDLEAATSLDVLIEVAYALRHAHSIVREEGKIIHGTLAPDVVYLTAGGQLILFGFADPDPVHSWPLAPEQQQGVQDAATDQWLLGALGIELLRHAPEVLDSARGATIDRAWELIRSRWPAAARILSRLLSEDPSGRYEAEERLIKDLLAVSRTLGGASRRAEVGARTIQLTATQGLPEPGAIARRESKRGAKAARPAPPPVALVADPDGVAPPTWPIGRRPVLSPPLPAVEERRTHDARAVELPPTASAVVVPTSAPLDNSGPSLASALDALGPPILLHEADISATTIAPRIVTVESDSFDPDWEATGEFGPPQTHLADARPGTEHQPVRIESPVHEPSLSPGEELGEEPAPPEPPRPAPADPVPDKWVYISLAVFAVVVAGIVLMRLL